MTRRLVVFGIVVLTLSGSAPPAAAQVTGDGTVSADTAGAFLDPGAAVILERARAARQRTDRSLRSYTAFVRSRLGGDLRMPLKDRNLFRYEGSARVRWSRDGDHVVQLYGSRGRFFGKEVAATSPGPGLREPFDPSVDRLYFGMLQDTARESDDFWIEHPLGVHAERHYRFQSGDTMVIRLQDGHSVRVLELRTLPRRNDPHTVRGVLWIDSETGALVRGAFRLARTVDILRDMNAVDDEDIAVASKIPLLNPMEFDLSLVTVEYSLWDLTHWLPRTMRVEGMARVGVLHFPFAYDASYQMQDVVTDRDNITATEDELIDRTVAAWRAEVGDTAATRVRSGRGDARRVRVITPRDTEQLLTHETLPPPIWSSGAGFLTEAELREVHDRIAAIARPPRPDLPVRFGWGLLEPGMVRYNRVEALSVGARVTVPLPYATAALSARLGVGDLHPNADASLRRETLRRTLELRAYHELATAEPSRRSFGPGNSLSAALFGRDEGEYYRATGASLTIAPPPLARRTWQASVYAEQHDAVRRHTHVALPRLWSDSVFRPNIAAWEMPVWGTILHLRPWWGRDPLDVQFGLDMFAQYERFDGPAGGQSLLRLPGEDLIRARAIARGAVPLPGSLRLGAEAGFGTVRSSVDVTEGPAVPPQRLFYLGGASTLRGYEPGTLHGPDMMRGRLELARTLPVVNLAVFTDYGRTRGSGHGTNELWSAGVGVSLVDGLARIDLARGFGPRRGWQAQRARHGFRLDLHLDAVL